MRTLHRGKAPSFLKNCHKKYATWAEFSKAAPQKKEELRKTLFVMQEGRCAYCERDVTLDDCTIDHFEPKAPDQKRLFDWSNLFLSCTYDYTCDRAKGNLPMDDCFKPDCPAFDDVPIEECFFYNANGKICIKDNLPTWVKAKGKATIDKLNLNETELAGNRRQLYTELAETVSGLDSLEKKISAIQSFANGNNSFISLRKSFLKKNSS